MSRDLPKQGARSDIFMVSMASCKPPSSLHLLTGRFSSGVGACVSPLISQTILGKGMPWRTFYWVSVGFAVLNCSLIIWSFHPTLTEFKSNLEETLALAQDGVALDGVDMHDMSSQPDQEASTPNSRPAMRRRSSSMPKSSKSQPCL